MDGHLPIVEWSSTIPGMVINFPSTVTHRLQDGQLDLEFDSSAAKIIIIIFGVFKYYISNFGEGASSRNFKTDDTAYK